MTVKVGFIGTGGIAQMHMSALEKIKDTPIVAVCDTVKDKAVAAADKCGAKVYTNYSKMLANEKLDACYVCLPPFAHGTIAVELANLGIPMLVEKPVHLDLKIARRAARIIEKKHLVSAAGYQDRYQKIIDRLQKFIAKRQVALFIGHWMGGMPGVYWWRQKKKSGGQIAEQTTHIFDMARYLFGEVKTVFAGGRVGLMKDVPKYNIEDASAVTLQFRSGLLGVIVSACCLDTGGRVGMDIYCRDARIEYTERKSLKISMSDHSACYNRTTDLAFAENEAFINAIKLRKPELVRSSYPDAVKSLELCLAANESLKTRKPVSIRT